MTTLAFPQQNNTAEQRPTSMREGRRLAPVRGAVWDLLCVALSHLVPGSGEHLIPNSLMTQHFPHHLISAAAEGQTRSHDHSLINKTPSTVWVIKNAAPLFALSHRNMWGYGGIPLLVFPPGDSQKENRGSLIMEEGRITAEITNHSAHNRRRLGLPTY